MRRVTPQTLNSSIERNAGDMLAKGKAVFRFETFGDEVSLDATISPFSSRTRTQTGRYGPLQVFRGNARYVHGETLRVNRGVTPLTRFSKRYGHGLQGG